MPDNKTAAAAAKEPVRQFPLDKALQIAIEETQFDEATATTTLEDANLRTSDERQLYAIRAVKRVKAEGFSMSTGKVPKKADTKVIEVARAIVVFAA